MTAARASRAPRRRLAFAALTFVLLYAVLEGIALLGLQLLSGVHGITYERLPLRALEPLQQYVLTLMIEGQHDYLTHDPRLGWTIRPGGESDPYRANRQGLRADREYPEQPAPGVTRIATFGDSFTHGDDVGQTDTWQAQLERLDPQLEVLNFGVPSYGPGQSLLRHRLEGRRLNPDVVVLGLLSENVHRSVNTFRPFYRPPTGVPLAKPRYRLVDGELVLVENPMPRASDYRALLEDPEATLRRLGGHDHYYQLMQHRPGLDFLPSVRLWTILQTRFWTPGISRLGRYDPRSEAFRLTLAIVAAFEQAAQEDGARFLVVLLPTSTDLRDARDGRATRYGSLLEALRREGLECVDVLSTFLERGADRPVKELIRLHNTALGNRLVAEAVQAQLRTPPR